MRYLSTVSAARVMDVSRQFVARAIKDGTLPARNLAPDGKRPIYRVAEADIHAFMKGRRSATSVVADTDAELATL